MVEMNFENMDSVEYDKALNSIAKDIFGNQDEELDKERVRLMQWALINLLINKKIISQEELTDSVSEATLFFKLLKRRNKLQESHNSSDSTED
ncbi:MAG: hypothetical protein JRE18_12430 [Deltaproteobacteria bacterium]|jgi:hypothetical protein|nr:hypothetical protein [Deltaproteobacteria bacterium]